MDPARIPVIVGVGDVRSGRAGEPAGPREPLDLITDAARAALADSGSPALGSRIDAIHAVKTVSWSYDDLPGLLAARLTLPSPRSSTSPIGGHWPAALLDRIGDDIAAGRSSAALLVGGEAQATMTALRKSGTDPASLGWEAAPGGPPPFAPADLGSPAMQRAGLIVPTRVYPLFENRVAHESGRGPHGVPVGRRRCHRSRGRTEPQRFRHLGGDDGRGAAGAVAGLGRHCRTGHRRRLQLLPGGAEAPDPHARARGPRAERDGRPLLLRRPPQQLHAAFDRRGHPQAPGKRGNSPGPRQRRISDVPARRVAGRRPASGRIRRRSGAGTPHSAGAGTRRRIRGPSRHRHLHGGIRRDGAPATGFVVAHTPDGRRLAGHTGTEEAAAMSAFAQTPARSAIGRSVHVTDRDGVLSLRF